MHKVYNVNIFLPPYTTYVFSIKHAGYPRDNFLLLMFSNKKRRNYVTKKTDSTMKSPTRLFILHISFLVEASNDKHLHTTCLFPFTNKHSMESNTSLASDELSNIQHLTDELFPQSFNLSPLIPLFDDDPRANNYSLSSHEFSSIQSWLNLIIDEANSTVQEHLLSNSKIGNNSHTEKVGDGSHLGDFASNLSLYIGGYAVLIIACIGLFLNTAGIYLLSRNEGYKNILNILRIINLIFDTAYLVFQTIRSVHTHFTSFSTPLSATYYILTNSGERFSYIASVLTFVALAHSQYLVVTNPFQGRRITLFWTIRRRQLLNYLLPTAFIAICFTIPVIFEIDTEIVPSSEGEVLQVIPSDLRLNPYYSVFLICVLNLILLGFVPFSSLLYCAHPILNYLNRRSSFIISKGQVHNNKLQKALVIMTFTFVLTIFVISGFNFLMLILLPFSILLYFTYHTVTSLNYRYFSIGIESKTDSLTINGRQSSRHKALKTVFVQIVVFILLHLLRFFTSIGDFIVLWSKNNTSNYDLQHDIGIPTWLEIITILSNLCMVINASVNYLIYIYLNPKTFFNRAPIVIPHYLRQRPSLRRNTTEEIPLRNVIAT